MSHHRQRMSLDTSDLKNVSGMAGRIRSTTGVFRSLMLLLLLAVAQAEQLPIKRYTTADGLANNFINRIVRDSRGYLWFCTDEGLSRFDGYRFVNYSTEAGLNPIVRDLLETRAGVYWVASGGALYRFNPLGSPPRRAPSTRATDSPGSRRGQASPEPLFVAYRPAGIQINSIITLFEVSRGTVWCGTTQGLFRVEEDGGRHTLRLVDFGQPSQTESDVRVRAIVEDRRGAVWIAAASGLYRRWTDGRTERYTMQHGLPVNEIRNLLLTVDPQLWAGTIRGLCQIVPEPSPDKKVVSHVYTEKDGLDPANVRSLFKTSGGRGLTGVSGSVRELTAPGSNPGESTGTFSIILRGFQVVAIAEDQDQNLWIGTDSGAVKLVPGGFTTYHTGDGLRHPVIFSLFVDQQGGLYATTLAKELVISRFDGTRFISVRPKLRGVRYFGWGENQLTLQDSRGEWWVPTGEGLFRVPRVKSFELLAQTEPKAMYTSRNGLPLDDVFRIYEDSNGDLWIATFSETRMGITRWQRSSETFHTFSEAEGLPGDLPAPNSIREDGHGNLWIGCNQGLLLRFRHGRFTVFGEKHGCLGSSRPFTGTGKDEFGLAARRADCPESRIRRPTFLASSPTLQPTAFPAIRSPVSLKISGDASVPALGVVLTGWIPATAASSTSPQPRDWQVAICGQLSATGRATCGSAPSKDCRAWSRNWTRRGSHRPS